MNIRFVGGAPFFGIGTRRRTGARVAARGEWRAVAESPVPPQPSSDFHQMHIYHYHIDSRPGSC